MPLQSESATGSSGHIDTIYNTIRSRILEGKIGADQLIAEAPLSAEFGVSRTPVHNALMLLEHEEVIQRASRGYTIKGGSPQDLMDVYNVRIELEGLAAAETATKRTELDLAALTRSLESHDGERAADAQLLDFHGLLWTASHNPVLVDTLNRLMTRLKLIDLSVAVAPVPPGTSSREHSDILDAVRNGDAAGARAAIVSHLITVRDIRRDAVIASMGRR